MTRLSKRAKEELKVQRNNRIIIYVTEESKKRFKRLYVDMGARNYEDALMKLLDIYEILSKKLSTTKLDEIKKQLEAISEIKLKVVE
jgi:hypothetical protein